jgi:hypothetical protein
MTDALKLRSAGPRFSELRALRRAISRSQIVVHRITLALRLADWKRTRVAPDVDDVVLAWIASHAPPRRPSALS